MRTYPTGQGGNNEILNSQISLYSEPKFQANRWHPSYPTGTSMRTADGSVTKVVTSDAVFAAGAGAFRRDRACIATMAAAAVYLAAQLVLALAGWQNR